MNCAVIRRRQFSRYFTEFNYSRLYGHTNVNMKGQFPGSVSSYSLLAQENKSLLRERLTAEAIANGLLMDSEKPSKKPSNSSVSTLSDFQNPWVGKVYDAIKLNIKSKYSWLSDYLGVSESTVLRAVNELKKLGYINSEHAKVNGEWQLLK